MPKQGYLKLCPRHLPKGIHFSAAFAEYQVRQDPESITVSELSIIVVRIKLIEIVKIITPTDLFTHMYSSYKIRPRNKEFLPLELVCML